MESDLKLKFSYSQKEAAQKKVEYMPALTLKHCNECYTFSLSFLWKGKVVVIYSGV